MNIAEAVAVSSIGEANPIPVSLNTYGGQDRALSRIRDWPNAHDLWPHVQQAFGDNNFQFLAVSVDPARWAGIEPFQTGGVSCLSGFKS